MAPDCRETLFNYVFLQHMLGFFLTSCLIFQSSDACIAKIDSGAGLVCTEVHDEKAVSVSFNNNSKKQLQLGSFFTPYTYFVFQSGPVLNFFSFLFLPVLHLFLGLNNQLH